MKMLQIEKVSSDDMGWYGGVEGTGCWGIDPQGEGTVRVSNV